MDFSKLNKDAETLVEAANAIKAKIAELQMDIDPASFRNSKMKADDETITVRYRKH